MYTNTSSPLADPVVFTMKWSSTPGPDTAGEIQDTPEDYGVPVLATRGTPDVADLQGTGLKAGSVVVDGHPSSVFVAAYLLTGSAKQAATAAADSVQRPVIASTRDICPSWKAAAPAIMRGDPNAEQPLDEAPVSIPAELRPVLRLSPRLRQCFVLRVLMAMPANYCSGLLQMDVEEVDANSCMAARELAAMAACAAAN